MLEWTDKDYWMFIILYGRNASTYKMGLGKSLIDLGRINSDKKIHLDELGEDLLNMYQKRLANGLPQMGQLGKKTVVESKLDELKVGIITKEKAITEITKNAKVMVLDKFHNLDQRKIPRPFFTLSDDGRYLKLNDSLFNVFADNQNKELVPELDSRWSLLEFGYSNAKKAESLEVDEDLEYVRNKEQRTNLTLLRPILEGYHQNTCFYCGEELFDPIHVDHVIPYTAIKHNEIWNLVLSHEFCNEDKLDNIPPKQFVKKLIERNEFVLKSDLPLKQELKKVLGSTPEERTQKVEKQYDFAKRKIVRMWREGDKFDPSKDEKWKNMVKFLHDKKL